MQIFNKMFRALMVSFMLVLAPSVVSTASANDIITSDSGDLSADGSAEFQSTYMIIKGWLEGYLGKLLIIIFFLVGLFMAIAKRDLMGTFGAFALAFIVSIAPNVLEAIG